MAYVSTHQFTARQKRYLRIKRFLDLLLAIILLVPASIIMLFFIIWIRLESKGAAIFRQRRPGYHQKIFTMYKLRSMRVETRDKSRQENKYRWAAAADQYHQRRNEFYRSASILDQWSGNLQQRTIDTFWCTAGDVFMDINPRQGESKHWEQIQSWDLLCK